MGHLVYKWPIPHAIDRVRSHITRWRYMELVTLCSFGWCHTRQVTPDYSTHIKRFVPRSWWCSVIPALKVSEDHVRGSGPPTASKVCSGHKSQTSTRSPPHCQRCPPPDPLRDGSMIVSVRHSFAFATVGLRVDLIAPVFPVAAENLYGGHWIFVRHQQVAFCSIPSLLVPCISIGPWATSNGHNLSNDEGLDGVVVVREIVKVV